MGIEKRKFFFVLFAIALFFGGPVSAKELANRLGVGYTDQFSATHPASLPSLAVRYYPSSKLGVSGHLGVDTEKDNSKFGFMAKLYRILFMEDNMNFYMGTGAGIVSLEEEAGKNQSGFELTGFAGSEFFFAGLDSLGFSVEMGISVTSIDSQVRFRTVGDSPIRAGIIFYF